ncbi:uncharacterized protein EV420DRAFT_1716747 [Desarmillaria tabescens]|uniref:DUF155 domain-containing protein n=1 Tax=Armillaria tabescens TaxID=1929756 RepID=A0AA39JT12_ARMTA|nr:uncharacterized protein EV420DRAFT_1716747 [Desarmillaria tabescens]KAK0446023.1 hypothetical protein EV420DRAFT_1716747 [Desarmillaria tabescens]
MPEPSVSKQAQGLSEPKVRGANRSTKVAGKLKVLPEQPEPIVADETVSPKAEESVGTPGDSDEGDIESDTSDTGEVEVYNQISLIPAGTARRDALRLTKKKAKSLPRVTAYATANSYRMEDLMKFLNARKAAYHTDAKLIDEVIYTPYLYQPAQSTDTRQSTVRAQALPESDLLGIPELRPDDEQPTKPKKRKFDATSAEAEIFLFEYGTVVIWGMTEAQEKRFLSSLKRFEIEKLAPEDVEMEDLNYYYANYKSIMMTKLSLSHALSQSVKCSLFEALISNTIEDTKDIPEIISETGKIGMPHKEIMQNIGQLFLLRTNINSVGSVLDSPEVFWSFPDLQPLYDAARSYLEIPQRVILLNSRVEVLQDMLQLLKESVSSRHAERLEQVVIVLIAIEIVLGIVTILVDLIL